VLTIRPMRADDDLDAELDLRHRSFGPMDGAEREFWRDEMLGCIADGRQFGVWDGPALVGAARYYDMRQFWHGRAVPMAGVGGVKIAPETRGQGVGRALMTALLGAMTERGYPLSALYPATARLYRSLGWEMAGGHYRAEVPGRSLGALLEPDREVPALALAAPQDPGVTVRRAGPDDADQVIAVLTAVYAAARDCGPATLDPASVRRWLASPDLFSYLAQDGFLGYGWHGGGHREILVHVLQASSAETARALWGIVASHASVTEVVHAVTGPRDPIGWLTAEPDVSVRVHKAWMLRVLDPAAAIARRGFPAGADARVALRLADSARPGGAGLHTLSVRDGEGALLSGPTAPAVGSPAGPPVALGPRGFAALYAGVPMATLRLAGLATGGHQAADAALDAVFGCEPYLLDYF
jgi:GNAT superfamily N-acetyltransferase